MSPRKSAAAARLGAALLLSALAGCTTPEVQQEIFDPFEEENRQAHAFNRGFDRIAFRPAATGYGSAVPRPLREGVGNFAANLGEPSNVANDLLQANLNDAVHNTTRFWINSTIGILGVFDAASALGLERRDSDFGETLAVWGFQEGAYIEAPFLGPGFERDIAGRVIDIAGDPVTWIAGPQYTVVVYSAAAAAALDNRYALGDSLDEILYESADSYALLRSLYVQNRRFELGERGATEGNEAFDPYGDIYDDIFAE